MYSDGEFEPAMQFIHRSTCCPVQLVSPQFNWLQFNSKCVLTMNVLSTWYLSSLIMELAPADEAERRSSLRFPCHPLAKYYR